MDRYVDGFVLPVPTEKLDDYREMAAEAGQMWMDQGALAYFEGVGDDLKPDTGGMPIRSFPDVADATDDESVVFAFIVYESRDHRDEVNAAVTEEMPDDEPGKTEMAFEPERMAWAGFRSIVSYED